MTDGIDEIKFGEIQIFLPKNNELAISIARKLLDLYEERLREKMQDKKEYRMIK